MVRSLVGSVCGVLLFVAVLYTATVYQMGSTVFDAAWMQQEVDRADPDRAVKSMLLEQLPADVGLFLNLLDASLGADDS